MKKILKTISWMLIAAFVFQDLAFARDSAAPDPAAVVVPFESGMTRSIRKFPGSDVIINIQDAHSKLGAQESISKILDSLVRNYDLKLISFEGASGPVDTSLVSSFPVEDIRKKTGEHLLQEGRISAAEFYSIITDSPVKLYGSEDKGLYGENLKVFREILKNRPVLHKELLGLKKIIDTLENKIYSDALRKFTAHKLLCVNGSLKFSDQWAYFEEKAKEYGIGLTGYENLEKLASAMALEKTIDFEKAGQERQALITGLSVELKGEALETLVLATLQYKRNEISPSAFHVCLKKTAAKTGLTFESYPNLEKYTEYLQLYESIDLVSVFDEGEQFESAVKEKILKTPAERRLSGLLQKAMILVKLLDTSLSEKEYAVYKFGPSLYDPSLIQKDIMDLAGQYGVKTEGLCDFETLAKTVLLARQFYELAEKRNAALLENTKKRMKAEGVHVAALVTGGFHSEGIADLASEGKISCLVIMPRFDEKSPDRPYLTVLTRKPKEYEDSLKGSDLYISAPYDEFAIEDRKTFMAKSFSLLETLTGAVKKLGRKFQSSDIKKYVKIFSEKRYTDNPITPEMLLKMLGSDETKSVVSASQNVSLNASSKWFSARTIKKLAQYLSSRARERRMTTHLPELFRISTSAASKATGVNLTGITSSNVKRILALTRYYVTSLADNIFLVNSAIPVLLGARLRGAQPVMVRVSATLRVAHNGENSKWVGTSPTPAMLKPAAARLALLKKTIFVAVLTSLIVLISIISFFPKPSPNSASLPSVSSANISAPVLIRGPDMPKLEIKRTAVTHPVPVRPKKPKPAPKLASGVTEKLKNDLDAKSKGLVHIPRNISLNPDEGPVNLQFSIKPEFSGEFLKESISSPTNDSPVSESSSVVPEENEELKPVPAGLFEPPASPALSEESLLGQLDQNQKSKEKAPTSFANAAEELNKVTKRDSITLVGYADNAVLDPTATPKTSINFLSLQAALPGEIHKTLYDPKGKIETAIEKNIKKPGAEVVETNKKNEARADVLNEFHTYKTYEKALASAELLAQSTGVSPEFKIAVAQLQMGRSTAENELTRLLGGVPIPAPLAVGRGNGGGSPPPKMTDPEMEKVLTHLHVAVALIQQTTQFHYGGPRFFLFRLAYHAGRRAFPFDEPKLTAQVPLFPTPNHFLTKSIDMATGVINFKRFPEHPTTYAASLKEAVSELHVAEKNYRDHISEALNQLKNNAKMFEIAKERVTTAQNLVAGPGGLPGPPPDKSKRIRALGLFSAFVVPYAKAQVAVTGLSDFLRAQGLEEDQIQSALDAAREEATLLRQGELERLKESQTAHKKNFSSIAEAHTTQWVNGKLSLIVPEAERATELLSKTIPEKASDLLARLNDVIAWNHGLGGMEPVSAGGPQPPQPSRKVSFSVSPPMVAYTDVTSVNPGAATIDNHGPTYDPFSGEVKFRFKGNEKLDALKKRATELKEKMEKGQKTILENAELERLESLSIRIKGLNEELGYLVEARRRLNGQDPDQDAALVFEMARLEAQIASLQRALRTPDPAALPISASASVNLASIEMASIVDQAVALDHAQIDLSGSFQKSRHRWPDGYKYAFVGKSFALGQLYHFGEKVVKKILPIGKKEKKAAAGQVYTQSVAKAKESFLYWITENQKSEIDVQAAQEAVQSAEANKKLMEATSDPQLLVVVLRALSRANTALELARLYHSAVSRKLEDWSAQLSQGNSSAHQELLAILKPDKQEKTVVKQSAAASSSKYHMPGISLAIGEGWTGGPGFKQWQTAFTGDYSWENKAAQVSGSPDQLLKSVSAAEQKAVLDLNISTTEDARRLAKQIAGEWAKQHYAIPEIRRRFLNVNSGSVNGYFSPLSLNFPDDVVGAIGKKGVAGKITISFGRHKKQIEHYLASAKDFVEYQRALKENEAFVQLDQYVQRRRALFQEIAAIEEILNAGRSLPAGLINAANRHKELLEMLDNNSNNLVDYLKKNGVAASSSALTKAPDGARLAQLLAEIEKSIRNTTFRDRLSPYQRFAARLSVPSFQGSGKYRQRGLLLQSSQHFRKLVSKEAYWTGLRNELLRAPRPGEERSSNKNRVRIISQTFTVSEFRDWLRGNLSYAAQIFTANELGDWLNANLPYAGADNLIFILGDVTEGEMYSPYLEKGKFLETFRWTEKPLVINLKSGGSKKALEAALNEIRGLGFHFQVSLVYNSLSGFYLSVERSSAPAEKVGARLTVVNWSNVLAAAIFFALTSFLSAPVSSAATVGYKTSTLERDLLAAVQEIDHEGAGFEGTLKDFVDALIANSKNLDRENVRKDIQGKWDLLNQKLGKQRLDASFGFKRDKKTGEYYPVFSSSEHISHFRTTRNEALRIFLWYKDSSSLVRYLKYLELQAKGARLSIVHWFKIMGVPSLVLLSALRASIYLVSAQTAIQSINDAKQSSSTKDLSQRIDELQRELGVIDWKGTVSEFHKKISDEMKRRRTGSKQASVDEGLSEDNARIAFVSRLFMTGENIFLDDQLKLTGVIKKILKIRREVRLIGHQSKVVSVADMNFGSFDLIKNKLKHLEKEVQKAAFQAEKFPQALLELPEPDNDGKIVLIEDKNIVIVLRKAGPQSNILIQEEWSSIQSNPAQLKGFFASSNSDWKVVHQTKQIEIQGSRHVLIHLQKEEMAGENHASKVYHETQNKLRPNKDGSRLASVIQRLQASSDKLMRERVIIGVEARNQDEFLEKKRVLAVALREHFGSDASKWFKIVKADDASEFLRHGYSYAAFIGADLNPADENILAAVMRDSRMIHERRLEEWHERESAVAEFVSAVLTNAVENNGRVPVEILQTVEENIRLKEPLPLSVVRYNFGAYLSDGLVDVPRPVQITIDRNELSNKLGKAFSGLFAVESGKKERIHYARQILSLAAPYLSGTRNAAELADILANAAANSYKILFKQQNTLQVPKEVIGKTGVVIFDGVIGRFAESEELYRSEEKAFHQKALDLNLPVAMYRASLYDGDRLLREGGTIKVPTNWTFETISTALKKELGLEKLSLITDFDDSMAEKGLNTDGSILMRLKQGATSFRGVSITSLNILWQKVLVPIPGLQQIGKNIFSFLPVIRPQDIRELFDEVILNKSQADQAT